MNFLINIFANFVAKRIVKLLLIAGFNAIGIASAFGIPIVVIVDILLILAAIQQFKENVPRYWFTTKNIIKFVLKLILWIVLLFFTLGLIAAVFSLIFS